MIEMVWYCATWAFGNCQHTDIKEARIRDFSLTLVMFNSDEGSP
jgi:hypothetical protein